METKEKSKTGYQEVEGDLIKLALAGRFDVIAHGCNTLNIMGAGIAPLMAKAFGADIWDDLDQESIEENNLEHHRIEKLGTISWFSPAKDFNEFQRSRFALTVPEDLVVINAYTQHHLGRNHKDGVSAPLDYEALTLCLRKMNVVFAGKHIGLPQVGAGLGGGDWNRIKKIIQEELTDCLVTVVIYKPD